VNQRRESVEWNALGILVEEGATTFPCWEPEATVHESEVAWRRAARPLMGKSESRRLRLAT
jgi:hypothetical protein